MAEKKRLPPIKANRHLNTIEGILFQEKSLKLSLNTITQHEKHYEK
ncbi:hypothetical protein C943_04351 [Mariniradius saccharolyticus AK6]|uniref:Uncharacterized protein n=1 Tax=Mariniradius saccharolyticus AK6 TaxID=1239962 RepID=M7XG03_9BACT|nr:hypothetical protein C943_04351 [Mariniradius saccharolyticus AK6]